MAKSGIPMSAAADSHTYKPTASFGDTPVGRSLLDSKYSPRAWNALEAVFSTIAEVDA